MHNPMSVLSHVAPGYCDETKRLYGVLNTALTGRDWLVGSYSIADMNVLPWYVLNIKD